MIKFSNITLLRFKTSSLTINVSSTSKYRNGSRYILNFFSKMEMTLLSDRVPLKLIIYLAQLLSLPTGKESKKVLQFCFCFCFCFLFAF